MKQETPRGRRERDLYYSGVAIIIALITVAALAMGAAPAPAASSGPIWLATAVRSVQSDSRFSQVRVELVGPVATVAGVANDVETREAGFGAMEEALRAAAAAEAPGAVAIVVDAVAVEGDPLPPAGQALVGWSHAAPTRADCQAAFDATMRNRSILFAPGQAAFSPETDPKLLNAVAAIALLCAPHPIEIAGHTETSLRDARARALSRERANLVRDYFLRLGVDGDRLAAVGYGGRRPVRTGRGGEVDDANRRIEFLVR